MEDIVIKTLLCAENSITGSLFNMPNRYNGYELFGFDIILDDKLKPWLLEVNISPSLHSSSPLDLAVKGPLIREVFNIVGFHISPCMPAAAQVNINLTVYCIFSIPIIINIKVGRLMVWIILIFHFVGFVLFRTISMKWLDHMLN